MNFKNRAAAIAAKEKSLADGRAVAAKAEAEGRPLTTSERARISIHVDDARKAADAVRELDGDQALRDELNGIQRGGGRKTRTGRGDGSWAKSMDTYLGRIGAKALVPSGSITVPSISRGIIAGEDRPRSILALIPFVDLENGDQFAYLRETVRTHAASTVEKGQRKPVSTYSLEKIEDRARTIAHLSEPINRADLMDVELLQDYLESALRSGVELELEDQVLNGAESTAGVLDDMEGILETDGIQVQPFDSSRLVTARKAVTLLENLNLDPKGFAWAMSPEEWEAFELLTDEAHFVMGDPGAGASGGRTVPVDRARRTLWSYPVVTSTAMVEGTGLLGDFGGSIAIREREDVTLTWSDAVTVDGATAFERNQVVFRSEGRWGLQIERPAAFVEVDLAAGS